MKVLTLSTMIVFLMLAWIINSHAANELVLHLSFDDGAGSVAKDSSKFGNDCTLNGNPVWIDGKFGKALKFDGETWGEVAHSDSLNLTDAMTIGAWVNLDEGGEAIQSVVEKGSAWIDGEYNLAALYNDGSILQMKDLPEECNDDNIGASIQDQKWHFLVGTWDGGALKSYIDGSLDAEMSCAGTILTNDEPLFIGARGGTQRFLLGMLDEVKIYNYALSEAEIVKDMENPITAVEPNGKLATTWSVIKAQK